MLNNKYEYNKILKSNIFNIDEDEWNTIKNYPKKNKIETSNYIDNDEKYKFENPYNVDKKLNILKSELKFLNNSNKPKNNLKVEKININNYWSNKEDYTNKYINNNNLKLEKINLDSLLRNDTLRNRNFYNDEDLNKKHNKIYDKGIKNISKIESNENSNLNYKNSFEDIVDNQQNSYKNEFEKDINDVKINSLLKSKNDFFEEFPSENVDIFENRNEIIKEESNMGNRTFYSIILVIFILLIINLFMT